MKGTSVTRTRGPVRPLAMVLLCGLALQMVAASAMAQDSSRRRRTTQEQKPLVLTPEQTAQLTKIANDRKLNIDDLLAASKTYTPSGRLDEYVLFSSGGQSGQVFAIGVPSMRLLRSIAVFTPESWQGYGFSGLDDPVQERLMINGKSVPWGDTHHPALSETAGDYDGQFLFIGDKANAARRDRPARLGDQADREEPADDQRPRRAFVTPDTDYVIEGGQYGTVLGYGYAARGLQEVVPRHGHDVEVRPGQGADRHHQVVCVGAAPVLAGPGRCGQGRQRRLLLHQLVQHRDGDGRRRGREAAL